MPSAVVAENKIFQALSDPNRRAIFVSLTPSDAAVKDLTTRFDISQPAVSQHLAMLTGAGLLIDRREGAASTCRVEPGGMKPLIDWIARYRAFWTVHVDRLERLLEKMEPMNSGRQDLVERQDSVSRRPSAGSCVAKSPENPRVYAASRTTRVENLSRSCRAARGSLEKFDAVAKTSQFADHLARSHVLRLGAEPPARAPRSVRARAGSSTSIDTGDG